MKEKLEIRLQQLREEYERELKQGSENHMSHRGSELMGEIRGIKWALKLLE